MPKPGGCCTESSTQRNPSEGLELLPHPALPLEPALSHSSSKSHLCSPRSRTPGHFCAAPSAPSCPHLVRTEGNLQKSPSATGRDIFHQSRLLLEPCMVGSRLQRGAGQQQLHMGQTPPQHRCWWLGWDGVPWDTGPPPAGVPQGIIPKAWEGTVNSSLRPLSGVWHIQPLVQFGVGGHK